MGAALIPYEALEVFEGHNSVDGTVYFVRDTEVGHLWHRVEYVERRLTCWCDDGFAHTETPDTEPECIHLRAVVEHRSAEAGSKGRSRKPVDASAFVD